MTILEAGLPPARQLHLSTAARRGRQAFEDPHSLLEHGGYNGKHKRNTLIIAKSKGAVGGTGMVPSVPHRGLRIPREK